jgi:hypothetical protein
MVALRRPPLLAPGAFLRKRQGWLAIGLAAALICAAGALQVNQLSRATSTSYQINELNRTRAAKQAENHELERRVAELSSLARVEIEARMRLGMLPADRRLYIQVNQPLPAEQSLPTRFLPADEIESPSATASFWDRIKRLLPLF